MGINLFNSIKLNKPKSNHFDLSHDVKLSCNMGQLVPIMCLEAVPGDKFNISCESIMRLAPMVAPMMHRVDVTMHYFFVPNRILWPNWEKFITNTKNPTELPAFPFINVTPALSNVNKLLNYMGIPRESLNDPGGVTEKVSALPFSAYQKIFDEYYRDQNLQASEWEPLIDGDNAAGLTDLLKLRNRAWEHDYFTASLPFAQKGDPVTIPISGIVELNPDRTPGLNQLVVETDGVTPLPSASLESGAGPAHLLADGNDALIDPNGTLSVENANTTINDLRRSYRLQEWLEKAARGGSRYIENILAHFGVKSSDKRLQRPEYITGTKSPIQISEVLNTTGTTDAPQGTMAGHGIGITSGKYGGYYCEEHGYVIGIMSVLPKTAYMQGIPKHFLKINDPFQYFWPSFANIGEQEVQNRELYAFQDTGDDTFGYVPRYAEYKYMPSRVAGDFQTTLDFWHMGRIFEAKPELNADFVQSDPTFRVFAVTDENQDHLWCHVLNKVSAVRLMPKFGTPTF